MAIEQKSNLKFRLNKSKIKELRKIGCRLLGIS
jgi:hypothetical protein